ncbi:MAG TPA: 50S ribosomal protein L18 [Verrucomicrobiae bacterium]|jgi:large subunit ribosomal protein L18|nr:50S ribosomal protein L18 [Verrucomicrobiae bacterium]
MSKQLVHKADKRALRKGRIRSVVSGTAARPRLSVYISNLHITAQLIDDTSHKTLGYVTTAGQKSLKGTMTEKAAWVGTEIAAQAKTAKIKAVVFDRGGKLYHGRVAALADAARKAGLEF